jgi:hypothetical protein
VAPPTRIYFTALLVVQQGPMGSVGNVPAELELAMSIHIGVVGTVRGCGFITQPHAPKPYRTFNVQKQLADQANELLTQLGFPEREPQVSWKEQLTGDAWTSLTLFVESCDATGHTTQGTIHHQLIEPARYEGDDARPLEKFLATILAMAGATDTPIYHKVARTRPPQPG